MRQRDCQSIISGGEEVCFKIGMVCCRKVTKGGPFALACYFSVLLVHWDICIERQAWSLKHQILSRFKIMIR
jgi:hypothetical protein